MYFLKTQPQYLKKEIRFFYSMHMGAHDTCLQHCRLPDGTLDIVFSLQKPAYISKDGNIFERMPDIALTGLYTDRCFLKYEAATHFIGAVLQPGYAHLFVNDNLQHHAANTGAAVEIFGNNITLLQEQMLNTNNETEKHALLEKFFYPV